jgi:hypothetical protein
MMTSTVRMIAAGDGHAKLLGRRTAAGAVSAIAIT